MLHQVPEVVEDLAVESAGPELLVEADRLVEHQHQVVARRAQPIPGRGTPLERRAEGRPGTPPGRERRRDLVVPAQFPADTAAIPGRRSPMLPRLSPCRSMNTHQYSGSRCRCSWWSTEVLPVRRCPYSTMRMVGVLADQVPLDEREHVVAAEEHLRAADGTPAIYGLTCCVVHRRTRLAHQVKDALQQAGHRRDRLRVARPGDDELPVAGADLRQDVPQARPPACRSPGHCAPGAERATRGSSAPRRGPR